MRRRLILKLARLENAVERYLEDSADVREADMQFDGGEWSGPGWDRLEEEHRDKLARRFGFATYDVAMDVAQFLGVVTPRPLLVVMHENTPYPIPN
jgi:hypothetical protein